NACLHILFSVMYVSVIVFLRYRLTSNVVAALSVPRLKEILVTLKFTLHSLYKFLIIRGLSGTISADPIRPQPANLWVRHLMNMPGGTNWSCHSSVASEAPGVMMGPALVPISSARKPVAELTAGSSARNAGMLLMRLLSPAPAQASPTKPLAVCSKSPSNDITSVAPPSEFAAVAAVEKT